MKFKAVDTSSATVRRVKGNVGVLTTHSTDSSDRINYRLENEGIL